MGQFIDMSGEKFGRLTVVDRAQDHFTKAGTRITMWNCICDCGEKKAISGNSLRRGTTVSCGCYSTSVLIESNKRRAKHNGCKRGRIDRLWGIWWAMKQRCYYEKQKDYHNYGGRGITVCAEWKNDYMTFKNWAIENGYDENAPYGECTIDRINVDGNYCHDNCRWVTIKEQAKNRRKRKK